MITYNPDDRPSASQILKHAYFKDLREIDEDKRSGSKHLHKPLPIENLSQYSRWNSDNASDGGDSVHSKSFNKNNKIVMKGGSGLPENNVTPGLSSSQFPPIKKQKDPKKSKNNHFKSEFKQSLKHNSSNHSITGKKIIPGVKKVGEVKKFYSPYSQRPLHK